MKITNLLAIAFLLVGCNNTGKADTWCEQDATDQVVDDVLCENGTPGYEWEPDGDDYYDSGPIFIPPVQHDSGRKTQAKAPAPPPAYRPPAPAYKPPPPPPVYRAPSPPPVKYK